MAQKNYNFEKMTKHNLQVKYGPQGAGADKKQETKPAAKKTKTDPTK